MRKLKEFVSGFSNLDIETDRLNKLMIKKCKAGKKIPCLLVSRDGKRWKKACAIVFRVENEIEFGRERSREEMEI